MEVKNSEGFPISNQMLHFKGMKTRTSRGSGQKKKMKARAGEDLGEEEVLFYLVRM